MELKILAIDTSNHPMSIALVEDDRLMAQTTLNMVRNHSVYVLPTIERLMDDLVAVIRRIIHFAPHLWVSIIH